LRTSRPPVLVAIAVGLLLVSNHSRAAELDIAIAVSGPADAPWIEALTTSFMPTADTALADTTTRIAWRLVGDEPGDDPGAALDRVRFGETQLALVSAPVHSWLLYPQNIGFAAPFGCDDPHAVAKAMDDLNARFPALDLAWASLDLIYLGGGYALGPYLLVTTFPVTTVDDLRGKNLSAPDLAVDWMWGTGTTTLAGDGETFRLGLAAGKVDGVVTHAIDVWRLGLDVSAPYLTDAGFGSLFEGGLVANRSWFDSLRPTTQAALRGAVSAYGRAVASAITTHSREAVAAMTSRGAVIADLPHADRLWWAMQLPDLAGDWAYELDVRNMPGSQLLAAYMADLADACGPPLRPWSPRDNP